MRRGADAGFQLLLIFPPDFRGLSAVAIRACARRCA
jgi:hypothetical protein